MTSATLEEKKLTKAAKRAKQEQQPPDQDTQLRARLRQLLNEHAQELDDEDRDFIRGEIFVSYPLLPTSRARAVLLLARFQNGRGGVQVTNSAPQVDPDIEHRARLGRLAEIAKGKLERHERVWLEGLFDTGEGQPIDKLRTKHAADRADHLIEKYFADGRPKNGYQPTVGRTPPVAEVGELLPAETGATVPAGIARRQKRAAKDDGPDFGDETEKPPKNIYGDAVCRLSLKVLDRHPDNRHPTPEAVAAMVESIKLHKLLEPIIVRAMGGGRYQILSGETRVLAYRKITGKAGGEIDARVKACSDAQALELLAEFNAARKDLTAIDKARLIRKLCLPQDETLPDDERGAGLTREQAARIYGLESGGAASNLVRLLELPPEWQDRVAAGELEWTWAREILKAVKLPPVMKLLGEAWKEHKSGRGWRFRQTFESRSELERIIGVFIHNNCRRIDEKRYINGASAKLKMDPSDATIRSELGLVEVEMPTGKRGQTETVVLATNADAFDERLKQQLQKSGKAKAEKAGRDKSASRELTPAQKKAKVKEDAALLARKIAGWRHDWLKVLIARELQDITGRNQALVERLLVAIALDEIQLTYSHREGVMAAAMEEATKHASIGGEGVYDALVEIGDDAEVVAGVGLAVVRATILAEDTDPRYPQIPHEVLDEIAATVRIDLAQEWQGLQETGPRFDHDRRERFFLLHQTEELRSLCAELKVVLPPSVQTRAQMVKLLLSVPQGSNRRLPLPKSIKPVAGVAAGKQKAKKKGSKS